jgi:hypothetical protein
VRIILPSQLGAAVFTEQQMSPCRRISGAESPWGAGGERCFATPTAAMLSYERRATREGHVVTVKESLEKLVATTGYAV